MLHSDRGSQYVSGDFRNNTCSEILFGSLMVE